MATLDILLPYYGDPRLMGIAVESVLSQESREWRLHVLDDAYPDKQIGQWIGHLDDDRVAYHRSPHNRGVNGSFQQLLRSSSADYVSFMGCDDVLLPSYVGRVRSLIGLFPGAAIIQPGVEVIDQAGRRTLGAADRIKRLLRDRLPAGPAEVVGQRLATSLLLGNWTYFPSLVWKRSWIAERGFRPGYEVVLDFDLLFDVLARGGAMVLDSEIVFEYRRHSASVSSTQAVDGRRFSEESRFFETARQTAGDLGWRYAQLAAIAHPTSRLHSLLRRWQRFK